MEIASNIYEPYTRLIWGTINLWQYSLESYFYEKIIANIKVNERKKSEKLPKHDLFSSKHINVWFAFTSNLLHKHGRIGWGNQSIRDIWKLSVKGFGEKQSRVLNGLHSEIHRDELLCENLDKYLSYKEHFLLYRHILKDLLVLDVLFLRTQTW